MSTPAPAAASSRRFAWLPRGWRLGLLLLAVAGLLAGLGWAGRVGYRRAQQARWQNLARKTLAAGDFQSAGFWASRLVRAAPGLAGNWRLLADVAEEAGSPDAVLLRARVVQLEPGNTESLLALAKAALRSRQPDAAIEALRQIPEPSRDTAPYHSLLAAWAMNTGQVALGEEQFAANVRLEPHNLLHAVNLASVRLQATDPAKATAARQQLAELARDPSAPAALPARRALLGDALRRNDRTEALRLAGELVGTSGAAFGDRLSALEAEERAGDARFPASLARLQTEAQARAENVSALAYWLIAHGRAREAADWIKAAQSRHEAAAESIPVRSVQADALLGLQDWRELAAATDQGNWGRLDFLRGAMRARAARELMPETFPALWQAVTARVQAQPDHALLLAGLAQTWGWRAEAEALWWQVAAASSPATQKAALRQLFNLYAEAGNTGQLLRVARRQWELDRNDPGARNNYAYLCLLMGNDLTTAHALAAKLATENPANPTAVSTYALSLYYQQKSADGLRALATLSPPQLQDPTVALCYALLLSENKQTERAAQYAASRRKGPFVARRAQTSRSHALK